MNDPQSMTDQEIDAELGDLRRRFDGLGNVRRRFRADAHRDVDRSVAAAREQATEILRSNVYAIAHAAGTAIIPAGLADAWVLASQPEVAQEWHALIDAATAGPTPGQTFGPMDRREWEAQRAEVNQRSDLLERERSRREALAQKQDAEDRLLVLSRRMT